ncbi:MAG: prolyl oligopeptidase family serine peptidase [Bacteroidales bacterium]
MKHQYYYSLMSKKLCIAIFLLCVIFPLSSYSQKKKESVKVDKWLISSAIDYNLPAFSKEKNLKGKTFSNTDILKSVRFPSTIFKYKGEGKGESANYSLSKYEGQFKSSSDRSIQFLTSYLVIDQFSKVNAKVKTEMPFQLFLDGNIIKTVEKPSRKKPKDISLTLEPGKHQLILKVLSEKKGLSLDCSFEVSDIDKKSFTFFPTLNPERYMDMDLLVNGVRLYDIDISPKGNYVLLFYLKTYPKTGKVERWTELRNVSDNRMIQRFCKNEKRFGWKPDTDELSYEVNIAKVHKLMLLNVSDLKLKEIYQSDKKFSAYRWSPKGDFIILTTSEKFSSRKDGIKFFDGLEDRWPWWRNRSFLRYIDVNTGTMYPLTVGHLTTSLQDISPDGKRILFTQSKPHYTERPFTEQFLFEMDLSSYSIDTVWKKDFGASSVSYSPDGENLLILGGPATFGKIGMNVDKDQVPNDFDIQAYVYNLKEKKARSLTLEFNPKILNAKWSKTDGNIYFLTEDRTYNYVYKYNSAIRNFSKLDVGQDIVKRVSFSDTGSNFAFIGESISSPAIGGIYDLDTETFTILSEPEKEDFDDVRFGLTEDWNFVNERGDKIEGRVYYPPNFDKNKKYPVIVYYYGGTSPTTRTFRGRYPKNLFAANGYIVYVLQPSGATGYGQKFSAMHVNNWGKTNALDIIEGTKKFLAEHSFADSTKVGCMGASYGGFMTMYLVTQTNIFSAAISHAGISAISSYWGEGYWGYLYSTVASANSFPWNNPGLYVKQSPLFSADKVNTPLLLLHGGADTNVPFGESIQFYTALKLLNKPVEMIEIKGQDHHIIDYKKRILWQKAILSWFDKNLKNQDKWWDNLFPEKNL